MRHAVKTLTAFAILFSLAACVSGSEDASAPDPQAATIETPSVDDVEAEAGASEIARLLGIDSSNPAQALEIRATQQREELIQLCMLESGFEYYPAPVDVPQGVWFVDDLPPDEHAEVYGFALSTTIERILYEASDAPVPDLDLTTDLNRRYLDSLPESEREAWTVALIGQAPQLDTATGLPIDPNTGEPVSDPSQLARGGCVGSAGETATATQTLGTTLAQLDARIAADPRSLELDQSWIDCMAQNGYVFENQESMFEQLWDDFEPLRQRVMQAALGIAPGTPRPLPPQLKVELDSFKDREIQLAVSSFACDDLDARHELQVEYERRFIDENRELFSTLDPAG